MSDLDKTLTSKREKTMLFSFIISSFGPLATGIPAVISRSATQIADFLRRSAELVALFISWWIFRKLNKKTEDDIAEYTERMKYIANMAVFGAMICSGVAMLIVGISRLFIYKASGNVTMGLLVAVLGLLVNTWFWRRYSIMNCEEFDTVITGQLKLYRAKVFVDVAVVTALTAVTIAPDHFLTQYIDAFGCIIVSFYLFYSGLETVRKNKVTEHS